MKWSLIVLPVFIKEELKERELKEELNNKVQEKEKLLNDLVQQFEKVRYLKCAFTWSIVCSTFTCEVDQFRVEYLTTSFS